MKKLELENHHELTMYSGVHMLKIKGKNGHFKRSRGFVAAFNEFVYLILQYEED
jgi:hypothetical protein